MNIFTANQVNQVYVVKDVITTLPEVSAGSTLNDEMTEGQLFVGVTKDNDLYFIHKGKGGITRSDLIPVDNVMYGKATLAEKMETKLEKVSIKINGLATSDGTATGNAIAGEDYVLNIEFQNPLGMSPDNKYIVTAAVHGAGQTQADFMAEMAKSLKKNMKGMSKYIDVTTTDGGKTLVIAAKEPDWIRGIKQQKPLMFRVFNSVVYKYNSTTDKHDEYYWVNAAYSNGTYNIGGMSVSEDATGATNVPTTPSAGTYGNGKLMADYEYFYMGERGDQYRMKGWPDYVPTQYMITDAEVSGAEPATFDTVGIHFYYNGSNHAVQKSEKDITFIVVNDRETTTNDNVTTTTGTVVDLIEAINTVADKTIVPELS